MWKAKWLFFLLCMIVIAGCTSDDDDEDEINVASFEKEFQVLIGDAGNLGLGSAAGISHSRSVATILASNELFTQDESGDIQFIEVKGKEKHINKLNKIWRRGGNSKVKAALLISDPETAETSWYVVDQQDRAHKLKKQPGKSAKWTNAPLFWEKDALYYLSDNSLIELDLSSDVSEDVYHEFRSGVVQAVMGEKADWMLELSDGKIVHWEPSQDVDTRMHDNIPSYNDNAEDNKFFLPNKDGFIFQGDGSVLAGTFYRAFWNGSSLDVSLDVTPAFQNDGQDIIMYTSGELCDYKSVGAEELMFCSGSRWIYQLGDASRDLEEINFMWTGHMGAMSYDHIKTVVSVRYVYHWTQLNDTIAGLTRIDLEAGTCAHLFFQDAVTPCAAPVMTQMYSIEEITASDDDTLRFCGRRLEETQLLLVEIKNADESTPDVNEQNIDNCRQLMNL